MLDMLDGTVENRCENENENENDWIASLDQGLPSERRAQP